MDNSNATENAEAGTAPFNSHDHEMGEDAVMLPVVSDLIGPSQSRMAKAPLSHQVHQPRQQTWVGKQEVHGPPATTQIPPIQSSSGIAVHIRTSASASPSHSRQANPPVERVPTSQPGREPRPEKKPSVVMSSAIQKAGESSLQPRKRGRPKGWKPGTAYTDVQRGSTSDTRPSEPREDKPREPKRRGRPPRAPLPSARERYLQSNAEYLPFVCQWKQSTGKTCPAELQNMKTLRKHVFVVHEDEEPLVCRWGKCAAKETPIRFADQAEFEQHVENAHFRSFVWHMGEGCQNEGISTLKSDADGLPAYLFDKDGNQVTPSVADQEFEDDQQFKERKRKLRRLLAQMDENAPSEEEYRKQTLGIA
ncbi:hypothetical protein GGS26DRAFT_46364 [Hypomontagnella submonticulosa]|nr:hypothetical protein GGS26DRAFT_46364 [Hypomontagnella submonticulosa]